MNTGDKYRQVIMIIIGDVLACNCITVMMSDAGAGSLTSIHRQHRASHTDQYFAKTSKMNQQVNNTKIHKNHIQTERVACVNEQESCAIAKMTARCALYK